MCTFMHKSYNDITKEFKLEIFVDIKNNRKDIPSKIKIGAYGYYLYSYINEISMLFCVQSLNHFL